MLVRTLRAGNEVGSFHNCACCFAIVPEVNDVRLGDFVIADNELERNLLDLTVADFFTEPLVTQVNTAAHPSRF